MKVFLAPLAPFSQNVLSKENCPPSHHLESLALQGALPLTLLAPADQTRGEAQPNASKL